MHHPRPAARLGSMTTGTAGGPATSGATTAGPYPAWNPDLQLLLGEEAEGPLRALVDTADGELVSLSPRQVHHQPGQPSRSGSTVVQYAARVRWADGRLAKETLVMATGARIHPNAAIVDSDGVRVGIWRWPYDPDLPALASAVDTDTVRALLADLGLGGGKLRLTVRAYRPGRRAVVECSGTHGRVFLKIVRPHRVEGLHGKHRLLARLLPVPHSYGYSPDGILVLQILPGRSLRGVLTSDTLALPDAVELGGLLDGLPGELAGDPITGVHLERADHYADVVAACLPDERTRLDRLVGRYGHIEAGQYPVVPVHGDFYEGQLLVDRGHVTGLLDVDTAAAGHRIDEWATLLAHLSVLGLLHPKARRIKRYGAELLAQVEGQYPAADVRPRISAAVLGLATGPFRVLLPSWPELTRRRIALAEQWLADPAQSVSGTGGSVDGADEDSLTAVS